MTNFEKVKQILDSSKVQYKLLEVKTDDYSVDAHVAELGIRYSEGLSTLLFRVKGGESFFAVLRRDDRNINSKAIKKLIGTGDFTFATDEDLAKLNIEKGLASPVLLSELQDKFNLRIFADSTFTEMSKVICGSGSPHHPIEIQKEELVKLIGKYEIVDITVPNEKRQDSSAGGMQQAASSTDINKIPLLGEGRERGIVFRPRILTGFRPTGKLHVGHYEGFIKGAVMRQYDYDTFIMIANVQALTDNFDNPGKVRDHVFLGAQDVIASGFDPENGTIFIQSEIPEIAELTVFFMNLVRHSEVLRNPTVKTEIQQKGYGESVPFGFVAYPVSQAADIHFCRANTVPVGDDQAPMLELASDIAKRFNTMYNCNIFNKIEGKFGENSRLVGTDGNAKMSKSLGNTIYLASTDEEIISQVKGMYTDPNRKHATDPGKVEGNPVFIYHDTFNSNKDEVEDLKQRYLAGKVGDVEVKDKLAKAIIKFLEPMRERRAKYDLKTVEEIVFEGTKKARKEAQETMQMVRDVMKIRF